MLIMKFYKISVYGRVHGVGFRYSVLDKAKESGLLGNVRNTREGVEIVVNDRDFLSKIDVPSARIDDTTIEEINIPKSQFTDFRIIDSTY